MNAKKFTPAPKPPPLAVAYVLQAIAAHKWPQPVTEHVFHPFRKWRLDLAWPDLRLGMEIDGSVFTQGRHTRGKGYEGDCEKLNQAQLLGWRVLRYSTGQIKRGEYLADLERVLG